MEAGGLQLRAARRGPDIPTFQSNVENRPIIRIGIQYYTPDDHLVKALEKRFPEYLFALDNSAAAGIGAVDLPQARAQRRGR